MSVHQTEGPRSVSGGPADVRHKPSTEPRAASPPALIFTAEPLVAPDAEDDFLEGHAPDRCHDGAVLHLQTWSRPRGKSNTPRGTAARLECGCNGMQTFGWAEIGEQGCKTRRVKWLGRRSGNAYGGIFQQ